MCTPCIGRSLARLADGAGLDVRTVIATTPVFRERPVRGPFQASSSLVTVICSRRLDRRRDG
jgi:hypothetical protein